MATIFKRRRRKPIPQGATLKTFRGKRVADFHATRHTYISGIVAGGASVKTAQELARHSTPTLTIGRYAHTRLLDLRGTLDGLPGSDLPEGPEAEADALRATGTTMRRGAVVSRMVGSWAAKRGYGWPYLANRRGKLARATNRRKPLRCQEKRQASSKWRLPA